MKESKFVSLVKDYLLDHGWWVVKYHANLYTPAGIPDLIATRNGKFLAIELKTTSKLTVLQSATLEDIRKVGSNAYELRYEKDWKAKLFKMIME